MKELNLEVGQKVWSIQFGDCEVLSIKDNQYMLINSKGLSYIYCFDGKLSKNDFYPSLFESNPFEPRLIQENKDGWINPKESKAELINALKSVVACETIRGEVRIIAEDKLQKLLESL